MMLLWPAGPLSFLRHAATLIGSQNAKQPQQWVKAVEKSYRPGYSASGPGLLDFDWSFPGPKVAKPIHVTNAMQW
jgi:hypothetical protein